MADQLKPCPFCGSADVRNYQDHDFWWHVECKSCDSSGGQFPPKFTDAMERAAALWNRRPEVAAAVEATARRCAEIADSWTRLHPRGRGAAPSALIANQIRREFQVEE